jgi:hypothetical protein
MNISERINLHIKSLQDELRALRKIDAKLKGVECADDTFLNLSGQSMWVTIHNRVDLQKLMVLSAKWTKSSYGAELNYEAIVHNHPVRLLATDAALPASCRLVSETYVVPASPERVATRMVVKCQPAKEPCLPSPTEPSVNVTVQDQDIPL